MAQGGKTPTPGQKGQGNLGENAAGAMSNAYQGTAGMLGGFGEKPPSTIAAGMGAYQNPWQQEVIDRTASDMSRMTAQDLNRVGGEASMSGAFGGSRHGLVEAQTMAEAQRNLGNMSATQRQQGFNTAANLAGQDINNYQSLLGQSAALGQQGYNMGNDILDRQSADGASIRSIQEALMGQSAGMFDKYTGNPMASTLAILGALSGNPLSSTGTTTATGTPGSKSMLSNALGIASRLPFGG